MQSVPCLLLKEVQKHCEMNLLSVEMLSLAPNQVLLAGWEPIQDKCIFKELIEYTVPEQMPIAKMHTVCKVTFGLIRFKCTQIEAPMTSPSDSFKLANYTLF